MVKLLNLDVGTTGFGLMGMNMPPNPMTPETAIPLLKHALKDGATFWNAAEFYGKPNANSLHLVSAYFEKYPEDADKVILSVKVGMNPANMKVDASPESIMRSYETCSKVLAGHKKIDILACARVDPNVDVEVSVGTIKKLVDEGKVGGVGISECSAATIRKSAKVAKIEAIEVEFSMFTPDILTNEVAEAAAEVGAVIVGYSPLGKGVLTGSIKSFDDIDSKDPRLHSPRFGKEALENNLKLVKEIEGVAERVGASKGQVALAWCKAFTSQKGMPQILPIPGSTNTKRIDENMKEVTLSKEDLEKLNEIVRNNPAMGDRYGAAFQHLNWG